MNKKILPFAFSSLVIMMSGCGGEKTTIHEDPNKGVKTSTSGCDTNSASCHAFVVDYPVAGLNFDCSTDNINHFITELEGNVASGGCAVNDSVSFYIQGSETSRKIVLGTVDLSKINPINVQGEPARISLLDIAQGMTKADAVGAMDLTDPTFKTMVALTRMFQAIGISQKSNIAGDVQPIDLTQTLKNNLSVLSGNVEPAQFKDGSYEAAIKAWLDLSSISEAVAAQSAIDLVQLKNVNLYSANFLAVSSTILGVDVGGFHGNSGTTESIASLYTITDRKGYSTGYTIQWTGIPETTGSQVISGIARINLMTQVLPQKLDTQPNIKNWISPLSLKISNPLIFKNSSTSSDHLDIHQGKVLSQSTIAGTPYVYKGVTGVKDAPTEGSSEYGRWNQIKDNQTFTGSIDVYQTNPATYLDNRVFQTINNVASGKNYIFPLYANLTFSFEDKTNADVTLGIVIDEHGDIRTNLGKTALFSDQCSTVNQSYVDTLGVQQFRIGTTGAANYADNDKSLTLRMILADPIFGPLDGTLIGLNENLVYLPQNSEGNTSSFRSGGVRVNLQNLLVNPSVSKGINITGWVGDKATSAEWVNMHAVFQSVFNIANPGKFNQLETSLAQRQNGTLTIKLAPCYEIKQK